MARTMHRLNELTLRNMKPPPKDLLLADGGGLFLRVRASGAMTFIIRRKQQGKVITTTLGQWPSVSLKDARAATLHDRAKHGPLAASTVTVRDAVEEFITSARWKNKAPLFTYLGFLADEIGSKRVRDLARSDVIRTVEKYRPRGPVATNRYISVTRQFFAWCEDMGYCPVSPAHHLRRRRHGHKEAPRQRVLTDAEIRHVWQIEGRHGDLLRMLTLLPARIAEMQGMRHEEINGTRWTIPASRTKSKKEHWYELAPAALSIIKKQGTTKGLVFKHATSPTAVQAWVSRWQRFDPNAWTPHDLRRTIRTRLTGQLGARDAVAERFLGHALDGILGTYDVGEYEKERIKLAREWAKAVKALAA